MKVSPICSYQYAKSNNGNRRMQNSNRYQTSVSSSKQNVNFNGYCGKIAGILAGGAAAVGLAFVAAPVLICTGPILATAGMFAGDKAEDAINEAFDDKDE